MRRRHLFAVAVIVPSLATLALAHGCSDEQAFESVCLWVVDPNNCYRDFRVGMESTGVDCKPWGSPTPADTVTKQNGLSNGQFLKPPMLDICFIGGGGQVIFDPPIDLTLYPPSLLDLPTTYKMTILNDDGTECGAASYTSPHGFSFTINPPAGAGGGGAGFGIVDASAGPVSHGTYTQVIAPGRDAFDVTCPTGESHHFDLYEVEGSVETSAGVQSRCPTVQDLVPRAVLAINKNGVDAPGAVSFTIYWPPTPDEIVDGSAPYPEAGAVLQSGPAVKAVAVTYFNCEIPANPQPCVNGVKDGAETDVDCGGHESKPGCPARCGDGQACVTDCDCDPAFLCTVKAGIKVCGNTGADGGVIDVPPRDCSAMLICKDKKQNGAETDVDCGGPDCSKCTDGFKCVQSSDCLHDYCLAGKCATPLCTDGILNLGEVDIDCSGPCPKCGTGKNCNTNDDCLSGNCVGGKCGPPNCTDEVKNGSETDVDCGGDDPTCLRCPNLKACEKNSDCVNNACVENTCIFPSCSDPIQDGDETDVNCGGPACNAQGKQCDDNKLCEVPDDCKSGLCGPASFSKDDIVYKCFPTSCFNDAGAILCGGGKCPLCADGSACTTNSDCIHHGCLCPAGNPSCDCTDVDAGVSCTCKVPTCSDNAMNGNETDVDCGGSDCPHCVPGKTCLGDGDCFGADGGTGTCLYNVCQ